MMNDSDKIILKERIKELLGLSISGDYINYILNEEDANNKTFMDLVVEDVILSSAWEEEGYYNDDDIKLAIGRIFIERLSIVY